MAEYIDKDKAIEIVSKYGKSKYYCLHLLSELPAADVQEVKRGKWTWDANAPYREDGAYKCDNCGCHSDFEKSYCNNCGANMRENTENESK